MNVANNKTKQKWMRRQLWNMINMGSQCIFTFKKF